MPEKLLTLDEAAILLGTSEKMLRGLVDSGELPAYKVGGKFLRFRREQLEAIKNELEEKGKKKPQTQVPRPSEKQPVHREDFADRLADFFYFKDFYIASGAIIIAIIWLIFYL